MQYLLLVIALNANPSEVPTMIESLPMIDKKQCIDTMKEKRKNNLIKERFTIYMCVKQKGRWI